MSFIHTLSWLQVKHDLFCWTCHKDKPNLFCSTCVRAFHIVHVKKAALRDEKVWRCQECIDMDKDVSQMWVQIESNCLMISLVLDRQFGFEVLKRTYWSMMAWLLIFCDQVWVLKMQILSKSEKKMSKRQNSWQKLLPINSNNDFFSEFTVKWTRNTWTSCWNVCRNCL